MNYIESRNYINSLLKFGVKPGLERIKKLLKKLGSPQNKLKFIHVAGTNGKGSTCTYISSVLREAGYKTGLFISPFVIDFRERIQVNGKMIGEREFSKIVTDIKPLVDEMVELGDTITEFEMITVVAMAWFLQERCDVVVLEVGLGGRYDATNVIENSEISVITPISLDHVNILGDTLEGIAYEKSGIIKPNGTAIVYGEQSISSLKIIKEEVKKKFATLIIVNFKNIKVLRSDIYGSEFIYKGDKLFIPLMGKHQVKNAVLAINVVESLRDRGYIISKQNILDGLKKSFFPSRLEVLSNTPLIILDGAHNLDGAQALRKTIDEYLYNRNIIAIVGMLKDKDVFGVVNCLGERLDKVIAVEPNNKRAMKKEDLARILMVHGHYTICVQDLNEAFDRALSFINDKSDVVLIFGSLYLASELRPIVKKIVK